MTCSWKPDWAQTRQHLLDWWDRRGLVLGAAAAPEIHEPHDPVEQPDEATTIEAHYTDAAARAARNHWDLAHQSFCADLFPSSNTDIGPGSLALLLGSTPGFADATVWFHPCWEQVADPESLPPLTFDPENRWWRVHKATLTHCAALAAGKYFVGCPDLVENIDILASLRGTQTLLVDMIERPDWVLAKVEEINRVWFDVYGRIYEIIHPVDDGGSVFGAFKLWGPGKVAKLQCDAAAMISPEMFRRLVVPGLTAQCEWLDRSVFHLDGNQCLCHLDALLAIDALDAVEWTPDPTVPLGGDPCWYDMYRRILAAGESVQAIRVHPDEVIPLLDAVGGAGMYIWTHFDSVADAEKLCRQVEAYR